MVRSPLPFSVAAAILSGEIVQLRLQFRFQAVIGSGECIGELLGSARTEDDRGDRRVRQNPSDRQFRQRLASLAGVLACWLLIWSVSRRRELLPFLAGLAIFAAAMGTLAVSFHPCISCSRARRLSSRYRTDDRAGISKAGAATPTADRSLTSATINADKTGLT
jgi:hypothetical protein